MDDDLDDLLDEVEAKFVTKKVLANETPGKKKGMMISHHNGKHVVEADCSNVKSQSSAEKLTRKDELSDLIDDICDMPDPPECLSLQSQSENTSNQPVGTSKSRCFPVFVGGAGMRQGLSTTAHQRACDKLRCTDCDFKVCVFEGFQWTSKTDYLFLRNNIPDFDRLKGNLCPKSGWRAYACQCKWRNIYQTTDLSTTKDIKWVCGRH